MEKNLLNEIIEKTRALIDAPTCSKDTKEAAVRWLEAAGTEREKEETVSYLYTMLHKVEKKANRDDCFLLFTELLDLLEELHRTEEVVIIQKSLMELS